MKILTLNFFIYTIGGVWQPVEWSSICAKLLYIIYTSFVLVTLHFILITHLLDIIFFIDNVDHFVRDTLYCVSYVVVCCKSIIIIIRRNAIINMVQMLLEKPCKPENEDEIKIQIKFDEFIRSWSTRYLILASCSCTSMIIGMVITIFQGQLPYKAWLPFNITPLTFPIISVQQLLTTISATIINTGTETIVFGFILQTCAQLEIFEYRLRKLIADRAVRYIGDFTVSSSKKETISEYVRHHLKIFKYAKTVNDIFNQALFLQLFGGILLLCTSVYYLSTHFMEKEFITVLVYAICMFVQIYVYCWSGNEVMLKSKSIGDAIYCMDWPLISASERKDLMIIMLRSTLPIKFTSSFLITLSLESYTSILKTSYSAFNVLQQS